MAIQTEPTRIQIPFADSGTKNVIPDTNSTPSASQAASWTDGFPAQCSLPLSAGGIPPARADFNGILNAMTQSERFTQEGGVWAWDATVDYGTNRLVLGSDGLLYWSVAQSGPNVGGAQDPTADSSHTYWTSPNVPTMPNTDSSQAAVNSAWINSLYLTRDYYVNGLTGDDANDGSSLHPLKTITRARDLIASLPIRPTSIVVHIEAGDYTAEHVEGIPEALVEYRAENGVVRPKGVYCGNNGRMALAGSWKFNIATGHIAADVGGIIELLNGSSFEFTGTASAFCVAASSGATIYVSNGKAVSFAYTNCSGVGNFQSAYGSLLRFNSATLTFSGSFTGKRYSVNANSCLSGIGGQNIIPGSDAGSVTSDSYFG